MSKQPFQPWSVLSRTAVLPNRVCVSTASVRSPRVKNSTVTSVSGSWGCSEVPSGLSWVHAQVKTSFSGGGYFAVDALPPIRPAVAGIANLHEIVAARAGVGFVVDYG